MASSLPFPSSFLKRELKQPRQRKRHIKINILEWSPFCGEALASTSQRQNRSFHVIQKTHKNENCTCKARKSSISFFKYANFFGFCCCRRRAGLSSEIQNLKATIPVGCLFHASNSSKTSNGRNYHLSGFFSLPVDWRILRPRPHVSGYF